MQKGKGAAQAWKWQAGLKKWEGGKEREMDGGTEYKSKTDYEFHCLVCHGSLAAPNPTPAILCDFSPLPSNSSQMHAFVLPGS